MKRSVFLLFSLVYCGFKPSLFPRTVNAQVSPDGTTNSTVNWTLGKKETIRVEI